MPRCGDVMIYTKDGTMKYCKAFTAQIQTLDIPGEVGIGFSPIAHVRTGRAACRIEQVGGRGRGVGSGAGEPGYCDWVLSGVIISFTEGLAFPIRCRRTPLPVMHCHPSVPSVLLALCP